MFSTSRRTPSGEAKALRCSMAVMECSMAGSSQAEWLRPSETTAAAKGTCSADSRARLTSSMAALREEAATSAALARVGEELIAAVNTPGLLERLSQLTTETIGCDYSWTLLRKQAEDVYVVAAHSGFTV